jgi:tetratricopeptide (TPR) repeat protein
LGAASLRALGLLLLVSSPPAAAQTQITVRQAGKLELHRPADRELGPGQADLFTVEATAGQFLRVVADQKGVDVWIHIIDPQGKELVVANRGGAFGPESVSLLVPSSGAFQVKVEMAPITFGTGRYAIQLTDLRDAADQDRLRIEAEKRLFAAIGETLATDAAIRSKAIEHFVEVASLWRDLQDSFEQALCLHNIGIRYASLGENQKALDYFQQALAIRRIIGDRSGEGATLSNMGNAYSSLGDKQKALDHFQPALELARNVGNRTNEASALINIGRTYADLGEKQRAIDSYTQALSISRAIGNPRFENSILFSLNPLYRLPAVQGSGPGQLNPNRSLADTPVQLVAQAGHRFTITAITFSPDGKFILTISQEGPPILWSVGDLKEIRKFEGHSDQVTSGAFMPDANSIATGSRDGTVRIWDIHTGRELRQLTDSNPIGSISISPNGDLIAAAGGARSSFRVHVWDWRLSKMIRSLDGHTDTVQAVAFSPDGKRLATASADHTARLWDVDTGHEVRRFTGHESIVNAIAFSPDGSLLAVAAADKVFIFQVPPQARPMPVDTGDDVGYRQI